MREEEIFHALVRLQSSTQFPDRVAGAQVLRPLSLPFQVRYQGAELEAEELSLEPAL